jgi:hypothetical protein
VGADREIDTEPGDPDAPWRRGYSGPPLQHVGPVPPGTFPGDTRPEVTRPEITVPDDEPRDPTERDVAEVAWQLAGAGMGSHGPDRPDRPDRRRLAVSIVLAAALAIGLVVAVALVLGTPNERPPGAFDVMPERADELWSIEADGRELMAMGDDVVVLDSESRSELSVLDARSGDARWSVDRGPDAPVVTVIDDLVIVRSADGFGVATYDASDGTPRWTDTVNAFSVPSRVGLLSEFRTGQLEVLRWIDGERVGPQFSITEYFNSHQLAVVGDDGRTTFYDRDTFEPVGPAFDVDRAATRGTRGVVAGWLVRCTADGELVLIDQFGRQSPHADPLPTAACGGPGEQSRAVIVTADGQFGVITAPVLLAFTIDDDQIDVVWSMRGRVLWTGVSERGAVAAVARAADGTPSTAFIEVATGAELSSVEGALSGSQVIPAWNGNLLVTDDDSRLRFVDADGDDRWQLSLDGVETWLAGPVAVVLHDGDGATITAYG